MHGRLKVKTSAQEQEEKRKERERKLKIYRAGFEAVFGKRKSGELDGEVLQITEQLLCSNPDIYTLWNIRRETLKLKSETKLLDEYEKDLEGELRVTEAALRSNPKSYGAWHHRMWVLETMQSPPLTQELYLCTKLLKADPRNFHCWDYRRWLSLDMARGNKDKMELDFSLEKLYENFSNYSAWHYRTLFLPRVHANENAPCSITSTQHKKELDLVQSAVFTDPADQSAWFYLRWLLGKGGSCYQPRLRVGVLQCCEGTFRASLVLNTARGCAEQSHPLQAELRVGQHSIKGKWQCSAGLKISHIWTFTPDIADKEITAALANADEVGPSIVLTDSGKDIDELHLKETMCEGLLEWVAIADELDDEGKHLLTPVLEEQLSLCTQLLDLEPDSRWALLTAVQLMKTLKKRHPESKLQFYDEKITKYLDTLQAVDSLRSGFYTDLRSDCILESALHPGKLQSSVVDLSSLGLTGLPSPLAPLPLSLLAATTVDLSANPSLTLPSVRSGALAALSHLPRLRILRIGATISKLTDPSSLQSVLPPIPGLLHLELIPDDHNDSTLIPKDVVDVLYKIMPSLRSLKPV